jgi:hypothetical protein
MSFWAIFFLYKCPSGQMSSGQVSFWANVFLGKCLSGQMSSGQMSFWANVFLANVVWANVFLGKYLSGQMLSGQISFWANVVWANVSEQMYLGKCRIGILSWNQVNSYITVKIMLVPCTPNFIFAQSSIFVPSQCRYLSAPSTVCNSQLFKGYRECEYI